MYAEDLNKDLSKPNAPIEGGILHKDFIPSAPVLPSNNYCCPSDRLPQAPLDSRCEQAITDQRIESGACPPSLIKIGFERAGIEQFNDLKSLTDSKHLGPYKISQIKVQWSKDHIIGLKFCYDSMDSKCIEGYDVTKFKPFNELFGQVNKETFKIDEDDVLLEVCGRVGAHINKLGFRTYKGHFCEFGQDVGQPFSYKFPGYTFGTASGGYGEFLDFLVLMTQPLMDRYRGLMTLVPPM